MQLHQLKPRSNMNERHAEIGFVFSDMDGVYWNESLAVEVSQQDISLLELAATECHQMALAATKEIIENGTDDDLIKLGIPQNMFDLIRDSWRKQEPSFYGRFDFALTFDESGKLIPKCYEYNADTPTSLFEASIVQWQWLEDMALTDQFNFIHEQLSEHLSSLFKPGKIKLSSDGIFYLTSVDSIEDLSTIRYLQEIISSLGVNTNLIEVSEIALADNERSFLDVRDENNIIPIESIFKLYPWEYFSQDQFFPAVEKAKTQWIEPAWKLVMSSKGLLAKMYEMNPNSPWLISTHYVNDIEKMVEIAKSQPYRQVNAVIKPCLSREGSGITIVKDGKITESKPSTMNSKQGVIQSLTPSWQVDQGSIMAGVWVVDGVACGLGLRLDGQITGDAAQFIPHFSLTELI